MLTADHGEGLGDHGEATHGVFAYESTLRVPLVLHNPRLFSRRVIQASARHVDILPTTLDAVGLPVPAGLPGRSLLAAAQGAETRDSPTSYFETLTPALTRGWAPIHGVLRDRLKFLDPPLPELYDLAADPREQTNLVARRPQPLEEMRVPSLAACGRATRRRPRRAFRSTFASGSPAWATSAAGGASAPHYGEADDPKRHVAFENGLEQVIERYVEGDVEGALSRCEALVRENPRVALGLRHLSFLRRKAGDTLGAIDAARAALDAAPGSVEAAVELGRLLDETGRSEEAAATLTPYAKAEAAPTSTCSSPTGPRSRGSAGATRRSPYCSARGRQIPRALSPRSASAPRSSSSATSAARARSSRQPSRSTLTWPERTARWAFSPPSNGRSDEAARLWGRALELAPDDPDTLFNLGYLLWRTGRRQEARPKLERFVAVAPATRYAADLARARSWLRDLERAAPPAPR